MSSTGLNSRLGFPYDGVSLYSIVVQGSYLENDMAEAWSSAQFGEKGNKWDDYWYGKTDYNYGFCEFFFKEKSGADTFRGAVESFYAETASGKWKTNGRGNIIDL